MQAVEQRFDLGVGERLDDPLVELRRPDTEQLVGVDLAFGGQPRPEPPDGPCRDFTVVRVETVVEQSAVNAATVGRSSSAAGRLRSHQPGTVTPLR